MRPSHRTLLTLLAALALLAAPVAARTLDDGDAPRRAVASAGKTPPATSPGVAPLPGLRAANPRGDAASLPLPLTLPTPFAAPADDPAATAARRTAAAVRAARQEGVAVLVDKRRGLPVRHRPRDLVVPRVTFLAGIDGDARLTRRPAARALERMFAAARRDGVPLAGVSGFRSFASQRSLFQAYASQRGVRRASHVSARAGHSEHQTGLVMDVAGADGHCAASACFRGTRPARWLARRAHLHGFVVRYPARRQAVTGYAHEPWHLRYVGGPLAREAARTHRTLDELLRPGARR